MGRLIGYARTSTIDQDAGLEAQIRDLKAAGCSEIYHEKISSVSDHRPELERALAACQAGDALMVTKPDRLARNTIGLLVLEEQLSGRGVGLVILSIGGDKLDTRNPTSKLILTILGGVATWEREIMLERQREGIAKAQREGKYKGNAISEHAGAIFTLRGDGLTQKDISKALGICHKTVNRVLNNPRNIAAWTGAGSERDCAA